MYKRQNQWSKLLAYLADGRLELDNNRAERSIKPFAVSYTHLLDEFDFSFQVSVSQQTVRDLATLDFIENRENLILLGPPGVGKSHLAIAPVSYTHLKRIIFPQTAIKFRFLYGRL